MGIYSANVSRDMFDESLRYIALRAQKGVPVVDADINDGEMISLTLMRRVVEALAGDSAFGDGFKIVGTSSTNDFTITGGGGSADDAGRIWVGGYPCLLYSDITFLNTGSDEFENSIHSRVTGISTTGATSNDTIEDSSANYVTNELVGRSLVVDLSTGATYTITANTATNIVCDGVDLSAAGASSSSGGTHYRLNMTTPGGSRTDAVYLNVYLDEIDSGEDTNLVHSIGAGIESFVRLKVIQNIFVRQDVTGVGELTDYVDADGNQHYIVKLATIARGAGVGAISASDVTDERDIAADFSSFVSKAGDTMTGALTVTADVTIQDTLTVGSAAEALGSGGTFAGTFLGGETLIIAVDGGANQTVTFSASDDVSAAQIALVVDAQVTGATASDSGGEVSIRSENTGVTSSIEIVGGTTVGILGFSLATYTGLGQAIIPSLSPNPSTAARDVEALIARIDAAPTTGQEVADLVPKLAVVKEAAFPFDTTSGSPLSSINVSDNFAGSTPGGNTTTKGILDNVVTGDENLCLLFDQDTDTILTDTAGEAVYGRLVYSDKTITLTGAQTVEFPPGGGTPNAFTIVGTNIDFTALDIEVGDVIRHPLDTSQDFVEISSITATTLGLVSSYTGATSAGTILAAADTVQIRRWTMSFYRNIADGSIAHSTAFVQNVPNVSFFYREIMDLNDRTPIDELFEAMILFGRIVSSATTLTNSDTVGGDLSGNILSPTVVRIQNISVAGGSPTNNQIFLANAGAWTVSDIPTQLNVQKFDLGTHGGSPQSFAIAPMTTPLFAFIKCASFSASSNHGHGFIAGATPATDQTYVGGSVGTPGTVGPATDTYSGNSACLDDGAGTYWTCTAFGSTVTISGGLGTPGTGSANNVILIVYGT